MIKLHALIEAIVTSLLIFHFNEPKLIKIFTRLELSNKSIGKLAFLREIDLLGDDNLKYIYNLSELRNSFVHNVNNCNIVLIDWVKKLDKNQFKNFVISMSPFETTIRNLVESGFADNLDPKLKKQSDITKLTKIATENPKLHIWLGAYNLLVSIADSYYYSDYLQSIKAEELFDDNRVIFQ